MFHQTEPHSYKPLLLFRHLLLTLLTRLLLLAQHDLLLLIPGVGQEGWESIAAVGIAHRSLLAREHEITMNDLTVRIMPNR